LCSSGSLGGTGEIRSVDLLRYSELAATRIQRSFRRSLSTRPSNRSLEGGGVGATTVVALGAGAVAGNHVSFTPSTDLNEVGTESMDNDLEANNSSREASDNEGMSSDFPYPADDVPDATETEYADESDDLEASISSGNEDLMADSLGDNLVNKKSLEDSNSSSSPDDSSSDCDSTSEDPGDVRRIGWGAMKGAITVIGATMIGKLLSGGGPPIDEDDAIAAAYFTSGGGGGGGTGGAAVAAGIGGAQGASTAQ
jgi:hypothetical protein